MPWTYLLIFCVVYLVLFLAGHLLFRYIVPAKAPKEGILRRAWAENGFDPYQRMREHPWFREMEAWENLSLTQGRTQLSAYALRQRQQTHRWAVCLHDYGTDARYCAVYANWFYKKGFHVLCPDARGCGRSGGKLLGLGYGDRDDVRGWINHLLKLDPQAEILLFGLGTGGAAALHCCCEGLPCQVKGVVIDSSYAGLWEAILPHLMPRLGAMAKVVASFANTEYMLRRGPRNNWRRGDLWRRIDRSALPILLIHGEEDYFFPIKHFEVLSEKLGEQALTLRVPGAGHLAEVYQSPKRYWSEVERYLELTGLTQ